MSERLASNKRVESVESDSEDPAPLISEDGWDEILRQLFANHPRAGEGLAEWLIELKDELEGGSGGNDRHGHEIVRCGLFPNSGIWRTRFESLSQLHDALDRSDGGTLSIRQSVASPLFLLLLLDEARKNEGDHSPVGCRLGYIIRDRLRPGRNT